MDTIIKRYNSIFDDLFFHHSVTEAGEEKNKKSRSAHQQFEIVYLIDGEVEYIIEGEQYRASPGDVLVIAPNELHALQVQKDSRYERIVLLFDIALFKRAFGENLFESVLTNRPKHRMIPKSIIKDTQIPRLLYAITQMQEEKKYFPIRVLSLVLELIVEMDKAIENVGDKGVAPLVFDAIVTRAVEYINEHIHQNVTLQALATALYVSESTLCHKFTRHMGISVNRYVALKKMHYAASLLKDGKSAAEVCAMLGYEHYTTFYHNYKQIIGEPPSCAKPKNNR